MTPSATLHTMAIDQGRGIARLYLPVDTTERKALWGILASDLKHPNITGGLIKRQLGKGPNTECHISRGETLSGTAYTLIQ